MPDLRIRPLGPITQALSSLRNSLFTPPQNTIAGISDNLWPNPLQPVNPISPVGAQPLRFPINWGQNINFQSRDTAQYSADQLRVLSKYIVARICIENNKDILCRMPRKIQLKRKPGESIKERAKRAKGDDTLVMLNKFIDRPNPQEDWSDFLRPLLDDMLVIDAASIFVGRNKKTKKVQELRWVEGGSITRLVDANGFTPAPPSPAYQQTWQGYPRLDLTTQQLVYRPRNIVYRGEPWTALYGMSPTEQVAKEIEIGMQRLQFIMDFYSEGTIPGAVLFAPRDVPADKIKEAQLFIDSDLAGNLSKRRRIQIFQGLQMEGKTEQVWQPKEPALTDAFDEMHIRKIAFAYGTSPQRLMRAMNRASATAVQESAEEEGTLPWLSWLKGTIDYIIQILMGYEEYEFVPDPFVELDSLKLAMADGEDLKVGLFTRNQKLEARGEEPSDNPAFDQAFIITPQGDVPVGTLIKPPGPTGSLGSRTPSGGSQPKAGNRVSASSSLAAKTNGHTHWVGCSVHKETYPRIACAGCVRAEIAAQEQQYQQSQSIEGY